MSRTLAATAVVVLGVVVITPSAWGEARHMVLGSHCAIGDAIGLKHGAHGGSVKVDFPVGHAIRIADATLTGTARIIDGDTLEVRGSRIRLHGIDAPESAQRCRSGGRVWSCGREATRALARRIGSHPVACKKRARDRYGRVVAVCRVGGEDVNAWMVAEGWAFAYRKYSKRYLAEEMAAKAAKRGVWRGDVVPPWDWRRGKRLTDTGTTMKQGSGRCKIKGNISKGGKRIYHVPSGRFYDQTRINTSRGERWFCSEAEARAAGWQRARQ
ncbi:MAG: thermonuclease family protein [Gammaproteobacteria bacterium]|nr:thermonuclease family protein [Gammaproteobacteria bacterium]